MKQMLTVMALAAAVLAPGAFAQEWRSQEQGAQQGASEPPGGSHQGYLGSTELLPEQTAKVPEESGEPRPDPGTLRKFNSNSGYGPEVQFDVDRREAAQRAQQQRELEQKEQWR